MPSPIETIKERLDIVKVISEYVQLKKVGANYRALCPFHSEKDPSFYVSPARQIFKCFGCQKSGDIFAFIMAIEGVEFPEALEILARKAGVELRRESPQKITERQRLYEICELSTKFFETQLHKTKIGREAKKYLLERQISEKSIKDWRLGYAPDTWQGLSNFLVGRGYKREEIVKAGLAVPSNKSNKFESYDRFRGRIMFPIFNISDIVIGFGGRVFDPKGEKKENVAKYINTPNTLIYDKSRVLYGINKAKTNIIKEDSVIIVEGYTDVIMSHQSGICNTISVSGTSLTPMQLKILSRYSRNIILCFDMDLAGEEATRRSIFLAQKMGFFIKIVKLPNGKDPADLISQDATKWQKRISGAKDIVDFYLQKTLKEYDSEKPEDRRKIIQIVLPIIAQIPSDIEKDFWIKKLAQGLNTDEEIIWEEIKKQEKIGEKEKEIEVGEKTEEPIIPCPSRQELLEEELLMLLWQFPEKVKGLPLLKFSFSKNQELFNFLKKGEEKDKLNPDLKEFVLSLELKFEVESQEREINPDSEIEFYSRELEKIQEKSKINKLIHELKEAEAKSDEKEVESILKKLSQVYQYGKENKKSKKIKKSTN